MSDQSFLSFQEPAEHWGGPWTVKKLDAFSRYVEAYLTILQANPYWKTNKEPRRKQRGILKTTLLYVTPQEAGNMTHRD